MLMSKEEAKAMCDVLKEVKRILQSQVTLPVYDIAALDNAIEILKKHQLEEE